MSWDDSHAKATIQGAVENDLYTYNYEIRVAEGTYKKGNNSNIVNLMNGREIKIYGSLVKGATTIENRDFESNASILDCENVFKMIVFYNCEDILFDGFTVTRLGIHEGFRSDEYFQGMHGRDNCVVNCTFTDNEGNFEYYDYGETGVLEKCKFIDNPGNFCNGILHTGGNSNVSKSVFDNNNNGALTIYDDCYISNCIFNNNKDKGAIIIVSENGSPTVLNCTFKDNYSTMKTGGGAIAVGKFNSELACDPVIVNCTFYGNSAMSPGGSVSFYGHIGNKNPKIYNCIFDELSSSQQGMGHCIYADNSSEDEIIMKNCYIKQDENYVEGYITYNDCFEDKNNGTGLDINTLHLSSSSVCIDMGSDDLLPEDKADLNGNGDREENITLDLDLNNRISGETVDPGAYERQ